LRTERNLWVHLGKRFSHWFGFGAGISITEWALIVLVICRFDRILTATEYLVNFASPEKNELARKAKDISAAAVLIVATAALIIGALLFLPKLIDLIF
jgi:diacylglycerol kinase